MERKGVKMEQTVPREAMVKISENVYEIPKTYRSDMRVPARIFVNDEMLEQIMQDRSLWQIVNVATLPGIQIAAFAMPDIHQGYGFPIGGVAATAVHEGGVISPGGIGYDINCGVRLMTADISAKDIAPNLRRLGDDIYSVIPSGVGRGGALKVKGVDMDKILEFGARRIVEMGYGNQEDLDRCEENGCMPGADPRSVSYRAKERGGDQVGTLGSGNHFLEIQRVDEIYDEEVAKTFGLQKGFVTVMIHCGSRGLGHQTCTDYVKRMVPKISEWGIVLPDRELACAPIDSPEGKEYFAAMAASANFAWANRHMIGHNVRTVWKKVLGQGANLKTVYDVAHNVGKRETHEINGRMVDVLMHRKGATRSFGPGRPEVSEIYRKFGHPVLIPGTMGTSSYVLVGTEKGMKQAFGSTCHGAGRSMSRRQAKREVRGSELRKELEAKGIVICCKSDPGLAEEAPVAYKDIHNVIDIVEGAGLARKIAKLEPIAVIKGN
jgi:tRNA-splicing ligase RtcB